MDAERLLKLLNSLKEGDSIFVPESDFASLTRAKLTIAKRATENGIEVAYIPTRGGYLFYKPVMSFSVELRLIGDDKAIDRFPREPK